MFWNISKFQREIKALKALLASEGRDDLSLSRVRARVMSELAFPAPARTLASQFSGRGGKFFRAVSAALLGLGLLGGTAFASEHSLPGEFLYSVKRAKEKVEATVAVSESGKAKIEARHAEARLKELEQLTARAQKTAPSRMLAPEASLTQIPAATSTTTTQESLITEFGKAATEQKTPIQIKAQAEAEVQVKKALKALNREEEKLRSKKSEKARKQIEQNIIRLKEQAESQGIDLEKEINPRAGESLKSPERKQGAP